MIRRLILGATAVALAIFTQGIAMAQGTAAKNILTSAVDSGSFKTLVAVLKAAGLMETLQGKGAFTVFAPSDLAFAKLPEGTVHTQLKPEIKQRLIVVLTYHVVPGQVMAADVVKLTALANLDGHRVDVKVDGDKVQIDQARVVAADIACSNGVIHVIDQVILPSASNIPATADNAGTVKILLAAAKAAGLVEVLSGDKSLTVSAPIDGAFAELLTGAVGSLINPENKETLAAILTFHVVPDQFFSNDVVSKRELKTVQGGMLTTSMRNGAPTINDVGLVAPDIDPSNGVIHTIDSVFPPAATAKTSHVAPAQAQYVAHDCPTSVRTTYSLAQPACRQ